jgi:DNA-binding transcriptional LysR family regulator
MQEGQAMNIENIEAFVYVNHYGSFNKAAEMLFLSQPSVTARIQSLERELDTRLFDRLGKQVVLTEKGKQFLPYAQQILQTFQKGKLRLQDQRVGKHELRIGCTISVSNYLLPSIILKLQHRFPQSSIKQYTGSSQELIEKLLNREIDIAFVRKLVHPSIQSFPYYEDPIRLYVYQGHRFTEMQSVTIQDIRQELNIFFECGSLDWQRVHRIFEHLDEQLDIVYQVDNAETAKKLVLQRTGICFLHDLCVKDEVASGKLVPIEIPQLKGLSLQTNLITLTGDNADIIESLLPTGLFAPKTD